MNTRALLSAMPLALCLAANAATVRTATETFVTNKIAEAVAAIPTPPTPDFSTSNATLVATIEEVAPSPDLPDELTSITNVLKYYGGPPSPAGSYGWYFSGYADGAAAAMYLHTGQGGQSLQNIAWGDEARWAAYGYMHTLLGVFTYFSDVTNIVDDVLAHFDPPIPTFDVYAEDVTNVVDDAIAALPPSASPSIVTNIVRDLSLGGIWDDELEVWWTPRMRNGSLTYEATTNVNLNAEN